MTRNLKATVTIEADNRASPEIRKVESALGSLSGEVGGAIAKWASFSAAIAGAGLAFREIGQELVGQEQALARFSSALGVVGARSAPTRVRRHSPRACAGRPASPSPP